MALKLQFCFLVLFGNGSMAQWLQMTVMEGATVTMTCPISNANKSHVEWQNPQEYLMFFNHKKANAEAGVQYPIVLKDKRYRIVNLSETEFSVSVSDVTFKDGGLYTCFHYSHRTAKKQVKVTVLGAPKLWVTQHNRKTAIKCSADGNGRPPKILWQLDNGLEIYAQPHYMFDSKTHKYTSLDTLLVQSSKRRVTVKCIVRHPALYKSKLMEFVKIGQDSTEEPHTTSTASHWPHTQESTETPTPTNLYRPNQQPYSVSQSTENTYYNDTSSNSTSTIDWLSVSETTENTPHNSTGNSTGGSLDEIEEQRGNGERAPMLVFLVTCLILALLVVVIFFVMKLRKAHIHWRKENEDSDQSVESSKSKSSHEEKQSRRRRGLFNIGFTKYVVEEPTETTTRVKTEEAPEIQVISQTNGANNNPQIKETEL